MDGYLGVGPLWTSSVVLPTGGVIVWWVSGWVLGWLILRTFSRVASGWTGSLLDWISFGVEDFEDAQCQGRYEPKSPRESCPQVDRLWGGWMGGYLDGGLCGRPVSFCPRVDRLWGGWVLGWRVLMTFSRVASGWTGSLVDWISFGVEDFEDVQCRVSATNPNRHSRSGRPVELHQDGLGVGWITCEMEDFEDVQC